MSATKQEAQQPLILRAHRLMEAFAKSDDERDFYLDRLEGFIIYVDLDRSPQELENLEKELAKSKDRYCMIPKLTFYEAKKIMEGFVNEKVYDIDTKEKLLDIIQAKEARENFLEFIFDHHTEQEKWQQYYQERSRIRIIEWLRQNHFHFVFEEDLEFARTLMEKIKRSLFQTKVDKDVLASRKFLIQKAKSYYSNEALNPRPKRGRPPKQVAKQELEPQLTSDIYLTVPAIVHPFLFTPEITNAASVTFSADFDNRLHDKAKKPLESSDTQAASLQQKLAALRQLSSRWVDKEAPKEPKKVIAESWDEDEEDEEDEDFEGKQKPARFLKRLRPTKQSKEEAAPAKKAPKPIVPKVAPTKLAHSKAAPSKTSTAKPSPIKAVPPKATKSQPIKPGAPTPLRSLKKVAEKSTPAKAPPKKEVPKPKDVKAAVKKAAPLPAKKKRK